MRAIFSNPAEYIKVYRFICLNFFFFGKKQEKIAQTPYESNNFNSAGFLLF